MTQKIYNFKIRLFKIIILLALFFVIIIATAPAALATGKIVNPATDIAIRKQITSFAGTSGFNITVRPEYLVADIVQYLLSFLGVIFIVLVIYAGFLWMTAAGDEEQVTKAKDIIKSAIIGLVIVLGAFVITQTVVEYIGASAKV